MTIYPSGLFCQTVCTISCFPENLNVSLFSYTKPEFFLDEFTTSKGEFIALSPKCYFTFDETEQSSKLSSKGVAHNHRLELEQYRSCLYENEKTKVDVQSLCLKKRKMCRTKQIKNALNGRFVKFFVHDDRITCSPLIYKKEYM